MTALDHAMAWANGERMEAAAMTALAIILLISGGLLWKFGASPAARAMVAPLLVAGVLLASMGIVMEFHNMRRMAALGAAHALDPVAFVEQETERVQGFMSWYGYTFAVGSVLIAGGLAIFLFFPSPTVKALALTAVGIGALALFVDFFSSARAVSYLETLRTLGK